MTEQEDDWADGQELTAMLQSSADSARLATQDAAIAEAATATAARLGAPRGRAAWPAAMAAGLILGAVLSPVLTGTWSRGESPSATVGAGLVLPADSVRGANADAAAVAVTDADPDRWHRYIQELIYRGDFILAEQHLSAFNRLYPDYRADQ